MVEFFDERIISILSENERTGQPGEKRHIPDRIDRRPKSRKWR
jgi:hypothetical protein